MADNGGGVGGAGGWAQAGVLARRCSWVQSKWGRYCYRPHSYRAWSSNYAPSCDGAVRGTWPPVSCLAHHPSCDRVCTRLSHRRSHRHPVPVSPAFGWRHLRSACLSRYPPGSDAVCSVWHGIRRILRRPKPRVCHRSQAGTPSNSGWLSQNLQTVRLLPAETFRMHSSSLARTTSAISVEFKNPSFPSN